MKRLKMLAQIALTSMGLLGGWKLAKPMMDCVNDAVRDRASMQAYVPDVRSRLDEEMTEEDRVRFEQVLDLMEKTPHGRRLLRSLGREGTQLSVVDSFKNESTSGMTEGTKKIQIKKECLYSPRVIWTLAHEAAHVQNRCNFLALPQTLDDAHTLNIINESLAEYNAFIVLQEVMKLDPNFMTPEEYNSLLEDKGYDFLEHQKWLTKKIGGKAVFDDRMKNTSKNTAWSKGYESQSRGVKHEAYVNTLCSDLKILKQDPDWDEVVRQMSGGEIKSIPWLPVPSWDLVSDMIVQASRNGTTMVEDIDLSCAKQHKEELLQGDAFKTEIFGQIRDLMEFRLHSEDRDQLSDIFKDMIPESFLQKFKEKGWIPSRSKAGEFEEFLNQQTNSGYLDKALKAVQNPALSNLISQDEFAQMNLEETKLIFKTYKQVFFGQEKGSATLSREKTSNR